MYVPPHFDASDVGFCHDVIRTHPFAALTTITASGELLVSHLPFLLDERRGARGTLIAHIARGNPQHDDLARGVKALVVFTGPHAYVSPTWYEVHPAVPTWNYCAVHAYGVARILDDDSTHDYLGRLAQQHDPAWRLEALEPEYRRKMVRAIVAFEIAIDTMQGKAKLSQNRSAEDVANVIAALESSEAPADRELAKWMKRSRRFGV